MCLKWNSTFTAAIIPRTVWNSTNNLSTAGHLTRTQWCWLECHGQWQVGECFQDFSNRRCFISVLEYWTVHLCMGIQVWHTKYLQSGPRKRGATALYIKPTPDEKLKEQTPEPCTWKIRAHFWHGGQQANLGYQQDTTRLIWAWGAFSLLLGVLKTGRLCLELVPTWDCSLRDGSGLASQRALVVLPPLWWPAALRLYSPDMDGVALSENRN